LIFFGKRNRLEEYKEENQILYTPLLI